jgi:hypothetical protein
MKRFLKTIVLCAWASSALAAAPNYSATATARIYRGEPSVLTNEDIHTGQAPVSASVSLTDGWTAATANTTAGFNDLHVRSSSIATDLNSTKLTAISVADWNDRLFFKRNGQDITTGKIAVTVYVKGVIDFQPPISFSWLQFNVSLAGSGGGIGLVANGNYDQLFALSPQSKSWNASDGLALDFQLVGTAVNNAPALSALTDFSAGSRITNIALLGSNGQPDPTVNISSSSGVIYNVPEPHAWLLAICSASAAVVPRRRKH